jgi:hypothetical protein
MGLTNRSVVLYRSIKFGKMWAFCPVDEDASHLSSGPFHVSWYEGKKKLMEHYVSMVTYGRQQIGTDPQEYTSRCRLITHR